MAARSGSRLGIPDLGQGPWVVTAAPRGSRRPSRRRRRPGKQSAPGVVAERGDAEHRGPLPRRSTGTGRAVVDLHMAVVRAGRHQPSAGVGGDALDGVGVRRVDDLAAEVRLPQPELRSRPTLANRPPASPTHPLAIRSCAWATRCTGSRVAASCHAAPVSAHTEKSRSSDTATPLTALSCSRRSATCRARRPDRAGRPVPRRCRRRRAGARRRRARTARRS